MASERWNSETTVKFIQEFKSYQCLWNQKCDSYKNKHARDAAFMKVAEEMNVPGFGAPEVKKKMRNLRSTYYQEKKKIQNSKRSGNGIEALYVPSIPWYKEMDSLLQNVDERRCTIENTPASPVAVQENENFNATHETLHSEHDESEHVPVEDSLPVISKTTKRKGIFRAIDELKKLQEAIKTEEPVGEDQYDVFSKSIAMQLRSLSYERGVIAQAKIQNMLSEFLIEDHREKSGRIDFSQCSAEDMDDVEVVFVDKNN